MNWFRNFLAGLLLLNTAAAALVGSSSSGWAVEPAASDWAATAQAKVRLVSALTGSGGAKSVPLGLQFELAPGWKTYWRSPGDAGIPVSLDWAGSTNLAGADMAWPVPRRFTLFGLDTFGYEDEVVFPIAARPADPAKPLTLRLKVDYLVCEKICIPQSADLALDLPASAPAPSDFAQLIDRYQSRVPGDGSGHGLSLVSTHAEGEEANPRLVVSVRSALPLVAPDLFVEGPAGLYFPAPNVALEQGGLGARFTIDVKRDAKGPVLAGTPLLLTVADGIRGLEAKAVPAPAMGGSAWTTALLAALLGGLILNLMPCVLPVLSLKLLAFVGHGETPSGRVRLSFLASAAGVLASFLLLAALVAGFKSAGLAIGWGFQFQQPLFLSAMALLVTVFAANLWGFFEVPLPGFAGALASASNRPGLLGDFFTGALATLLATPCTAPFLATALGFALAGGPAEIFAIFLALGLGLGAPYLLLAAAPSLARHLPRPGPWMVWLKRALGFALLGTALWLLAVLAAQIGVKASLLTGGALVALLLILTLRRLVPARRWTAVAAMAVVAVLAPMVLAEVPVTVAAEDGAWRKFDEAAIARLVGEGHVVLVDVTADWCINCQINKLLVLDRGWAAQALASGRVIGLKADWTNPDPAVARYLAGFARYGIPFNAVYGPRAPQGLALPPVLSEEAVRQAVEQAGGT
jgi:suppressor for copper-sensitivity B